MNRERNTFLQINGGNRSSHNARLRMEKTRYADTPHPEHLLRDQPPFPHLVLNELRPGDHEQGLPNTEADSRRDAAEQPFVVVNEKRLTSCISRCMDNSHQR